MLYCEKKIRLINGGLAVFLVMVMAVFSGCASKGAKPDTDYEAPAAEAQPELFSDSLGGQTKLITAVKTSEGDDYFVISIRGDSVLTYTSVKQPLPPSLVLYFPDTALGGTVTPEMMLYNDYINGIKSSEIIEGGPTKITIGLKQDSAYELNREGSGVRIAFGNAPPVTETAADETEQYAAMEETELETELIDDEIYQEDDEASEEDATALMTGSELEGVDAEVLDDGVKIMIEADGAITDYKDFSIPVSDTLPARIVFDVYNIDSPYTKQEKVPVNSRWVKKVRHFAHPDKIRFVIETDQMFLSSYSAKAVNNGLLIQIGDTVEKEPTEIVQEEPAEPEAVADIQEDTPSEIDAAETDEEEPVLTESEPDEYVPDEEMEIDYSTPALLNRSDFASNEDGTSTIIIGTTRPVKYTIGKLSSGEIQLKLFDTNILRYRQRPIITTRFESAVDRITPVQKADMKGYSLIMVEVRESVPYVVEQVDSQIFVHFEASSIKPKPLAEAGLPPWQVILNRATDEPVEVSGTEATADVPAPGTVTAEGVVEDNTGVIEVEETIPGIIEDTATDEAVEDFEVTEEVADEDIEEMLEEEDPSLFEALGPKTLRTTSKKKYTGEKIALDFYQTDIKNVLRIIRDVSGRNFAIDKDVKGKVTLTLVQPIPWDQVLDLVVKMNQLGMIDEGEIIRITTQETLQQEEQRQQEILDARRERKRSEEAVIDLITEYLPISYATVGDIAPHVEKILTPERGTITHDTRNNQLIIRDTPKKVEMAREIVRKIDKVTPQVVIEARIVEVTETFSRAIGTEWNMSSDLNVGAYYNSHALTVAMNHAVAPTGTIGYTFSKLKGTPITLDAKLRAAETEGHGKVISTPKIVTLDNVSAKITQGSEWPYAKEEDDDITIEFKEIKLELHVTPHITPDDRISLKVKLLKEDIKQITDDGPALSTSEAETELLINDGDTIVIGGIIKETTNNDEFRWPWLGNIPLVGWLFKAKQSTGDKLELLIFLTPKIVHLEG